jgi:hypothetical protein
MDSKDLLWKGDNLLRKGKPLVAIVPDAKYPGLWRVQLPDGQLSDLANKIRARAAARGLAVDILERTKLISAAVPQPIK